METVAVIAKVYCRVFVYHFFRKLNKQHCRANTTQSFLVLGILIKAKCVSVSVGFRNIANRKRILLLKIIL